MSRALDDLKEPFRGIAFQILARLVEANIPILIVDTLRTSAEHQINLVNGSSWVKRSKHLDGLAIDICPYEEYKLNGPNKLQWTTSNPIWQKIGQIGKAVDARIIWGGDWKKKDMGHFELRT